MLAAAQGGEPSSEPDVWRALANPWRRRLLDLLRDAPQTTGFLADAIPELSRFAVMQHLDVLAQAGVVLVVRRGRHRFNHLNPVPLRDWYERWVQPLADSAAADLLNLKRIVERTGDTTMSTTDETRTVRLACELRFRTTPERLFKAFTDDTLAWFPHSYGGERTKAVVVEPSVGGRHYEDWGDGRGHLYGHVTVYDPPHHLATRGRLMPGTIHDSEYEIEADGEESILRMTKVVTGPMNDDEAASIHTYGDLTMFADAIRAHVES